MAKIKQNEKVTRYVQSAIDVAERAVAESTRAEVDAKAAVAEVAAAREKAEAKLAEIEKAVEQVNVDAEVIRAKVSEALVTIDEKAKAAVLPLQAEIERVAREVDVFKATMLAAGAEAETRIIERYKALLAELANGVEVAGLKTVLSGIDGAIGRLEKAAKDCKGARGTVLDAAKRLPTSAVTATAVDGPAADVPRMPAQSTLAELPAEPVNAESAESTTATTPEGIETVAGGA